MKDATTAIGNRDPVKYAREAHYRAELEHARAHRLELALRKMVEMNFTAEAMRAIVRNALAGVEELHNRRDDDVA